MQHLFVYSSTSGENKPPANCCQVSPHCTPSSCRGYQKVARYASPAFSCTPPAGQPDQANRSRPRVHRRENIQQVLLSSNQPGTRACKNAILSARDRLPMVGRLQRIRHYYFKPYTTPPVVGFLETSNRSTTVADSNCASRSLGAFPRTGTLLNLDLCYTNTLLRCGLLYQRHNHPTSSISFGFLCSQDSTDWNLRQQAEATAAQ